MWFLAVRFGALFTEVRDGLWEAEMQEAPVGPGRSHSLGFLYTLVICVQSEAGTPRKRRGVGQRLSEDGISRDVALVMDVRGWMGSAF